MHITELDGVIWTTFEPSENPEMVGVVEKLCEDISKDDIDLAENYLPKRFDMDNQIAISLGNLEGKWVSMATLHRRPIYGKKVLRTMNRYWKHRDFRITTGSVPKKSKVASLAIIPHHVNIAQKHGYQSLFISRNEEASKYFKWLTGVFKREMNMDWFAPKERIQVCEPASSPSCWQYVIYCSLDGQTKPLTLESSK